MNIPKNLSEITIGQMERISKEIEIDDKDRRYKEIAILCNVTYDDIYNLPVQELLDTIKQINWFYELKPEDIEPKLDFTFNGKDYTLLSEYGNLTGGQAIDIETFRKMYADNYWLMTKNIMAVCLYENNKLVDFEKAITIIENIGLDVIYPYLSFFLTKKKSSDQYTNLIMKGSRLSQNMDIYTKKSQKNMDYLTRFGILLGKILFNLTIFLGIIYTKLYMPCKSVMKKLLLKIK